MLGITIPRSSLDIKSMTLRSALAVSGFTYWLVKYMPVFIITVSFFFSWTASISVGILSLFVVFKLYKMGYLSIDSDETVNDKLD